MTKVLFAISEWGYWGEELIGPLEACDKAGYEAEFLTPTGARPTPLAVSMLTDYVDPPQGKSVTEQSMADRTREFDSVEQWWFDDVDALRAALDSTFFTEKVAPARAEIVDPRYVFSMTARENWVIGP